MSNRTPTKRPRGKPQPTPGDEKDRQRPGKRKQVQEQPAPEEIEQKQIEEPQEDPIKKTENIYSEYIIIPTYYDPTEPPQNKELKVDISVDITEKDEVAAIHFVLCDNEDIFFCMKSDYRKREYEKVKSKERYHSKFEELPGILIQMLNSFKNVEPDFNIFIEMQTDTCELMIQQQTNLFVKDLISFKFYSVSEEESDKLAQEAYYIVRTKLINKKNQYEIYMSALMKKNPDIYNDIQINGMDYIHTPEEKIRALEHFLEKDEKVAAGIAELERKNLEPNFKTNKKLSNKDSK